MPTDIVYCPAGAGCRRSEKRNGICKNWQILHADANARTRTKSELLKNGRSKMTRHRKKLIEVALPLDAINAAAAWAVIFAQMVNDPSARPKFFATTVPQ